jgi:DHA2 family multidrug resistance protein
MTAETPAEAPVTWTPRFNPWLIGVVVALAAFMEVLDTSIANVALPHIAGNLGASNDESTWVLTSYLVSNAIVLPLSGWLASVFGRKRFFLICIALFTLSSLFCGLAPTLGWLIFARVLQGVAGGGLQPLAQAILADSFPPAARGMAFAMYGFTVVIAPTVGPVLGGWITDNYSWRWIFFINAPVGLLTLAWVRRVVEDPPYLARSLGAAVKIDYIGIALLTLGIGALQIMLDKGQEDDWFGSHFIVALAITAAVCLAALVVWEWRHVAPVIEVRLFKNSNFAAANLMIFFVGAVYFSSLVMMPLFLQSLLGYDAKTAGLVLSLGGLVTLVTLPLVGRLTTMFQARYLVAAGWTAIVCAMALTALRLNLLVSYEEARWLRLTQSVGLGFLFIPINLAAYSGIAPEKSGSVSGILNFMRNMGSSVGTSVVSTMLYRRAEFHHLHLVGRTNSFNPGFRAAAAALSSRLGGDQAAYAALYRAVLREAQMLAYVDTFWLLAAAGALMLALSSLLKRNELGAASAEAAAG